MRSIRVFIGASNELGEFRAGTMGKVIGTLVGSSPLGAVIAVATGGAATMAVAAIWSSASPSFGRQGGSTGAKLDFAGLLPLVHRHFPGFGP